MTDPRRIFANIPFPKASQLLGFQPLEMDAATGRVVIQFEGKPEFANPMGNIQGGFLAAMLDECMAVAALAKSNFTVVVPTLEMKVSYLMPAGIGRLVGTGRVVKLGKSIAFLEGELADDKGDILARASATGMVVPAPWLKKSETS